MPTPITSVDQLDPNASYTYADYLTWQFTEWVELIKGKVMRRMAGPTDLHQVVIGELHRRIANLLYRQRCQVRIAPYDVRLLKRGAATDAAHIRTVVQPDLCVICDPTKIEPRGCLGAPDLIIEILSPGTATRDWKDKFDLYEENGVTEYWIVDPLGQSLSVFVLDEATARYRFVGEFATPGPVPCHTLPGLGLEWADIFADD
jgi:Uma2 family endonuclease